MKEFIARWKSESPEYFKAIGNFGKWLAGAGAILMASTLAAPETISVSLIKTIQLVSSYMIFGGGIIAGLCKLPVADYDALQDKINKPKEEETKP
jgi:hypothetical protein